MERVFSPNKVCCILSALTLSLLIILPILLGIIVILFNNTDKLSYNNIFFISLIIGVCSFFVTFRFFSDKKIIINIDGDVFIRNKHIGNVVDIEKINMFEIKGFEQNIKIQFKKSNMILNVRMYKDILKGFSEELIERNNKIRADKITQYILFNPHEAVKIETKKAIKHTIISIILAITLIVIIHFLLNK